MDINIGGLGEGGEGGDSWVACTTGEGHGSISLPSSYSIPDVKTSILFMQHSSLPD